MTSPRHLAAVTATLKKLSGKKWSEHAATPTILYVDCQMDIGIELRRLEGLRRYAAAHKWHVETLEHDNCTPDTLREALARLRPVGCAAECWRPGISLPPALFGRVPVVYFGRQDGPGWRNALSVECDDASVARLAFKELSATNPPAYAIATHNVREHWAYERINAFCECCQKAGFDCPVAHFPIETDEEKAAQPGLMASWATALPKRCAVFTVNDFCAQNVAMALAEAGRPFPRTVTLVGADGAETLTWNRELVETISTIRLDFELAGFLAAKMIGKIADGARVPLGATATFPPLMVSRRKSTRGYGRREQHILEAMKTIRREACDGLTVAKLAAHFPGTRRLFDMRFREAVGHSALDEILNVRLERAMDLLAHSDMPIEAVAHFSGFKTEWEFWKIFKKRTGKPPLQFRNARK